MKGIHHITQATSQYGRWTLFSKLHSTIKQFSSHLLADGAAVISPLWNSPMMLSSMFSINLGLPSNQLLWRSSPQVRYICSLRRWPFCVWEPISSIHGWFGEGDWLDLLQLPIAQLWHQALESLPWQLAGGWLALKRGSVPPWGCCRRDFWLL